ncbi:hypothetical protein CLF_101120 [Clonorchis sinensis]|uniref:Uncharacterized protein n=1 Tax=Clonorchis sinensis TaxID=79923 RepID=G7Y515_CLOSI|nr:hypothetical protein CLF_101120 [Clonorchis sinensis]
MKFNFGTYRHRCMCLLTFDQVSVVLEIAKIKIEQRRGSNLDKDSQEYTAFKIGTSLFACIADPQSHPLECYSATLVDEDVYALVTARHQTPRWFGIPYRTFFLVYEAHMLNTVQFGTTNRFQVSTGLVDDAHLAFEYDQSDLMFLKDSEVGNCKVTEKIRSLAQFVHCLQSDPIYVEEKAALTEIRNLWEGFQRQIVTPTFQWCQYKLPPTNVKGLNLISNTGFNRGAVPMPLTRDVTQARCEEKNENHRCVYGKPSTMLAELALDYCQTVLGYPTVNRNTLLIRFSKLHIRHFRYSVTDRLKQPDADSTVLTRPMPYV